MDELELSSDQEKKILDSWNSNPSNPPSLKDLTVTAYGDGYDGRSLQARAVKKFLASKNLKARTSMDYQSKTGEIELSEAHHQYITNNVSTMNALEMAQIIFANPALTNLNAETRAINEYIKKLNPRVVFSVEAVKDVPSGNYEPPKTFDQALKRINQYITYVEDRSKVTATQKKNVDMLINYMHTYRFIAQMNNFQTESERRLCEDAFIRSTYDKNDLAQEEVDQYIEYANQVVMGSNIQRRSNKLQSILEKISGNDPDSMKISIGLVESIGKASTEFHQCKQREQKLLDDLKEKRSVRMSKNLQENASVLNLIQAWKDEESRAELLMHAEKEQSAVSKEVDRLSSLPDLKARILGLVKEEIRNG